MKKRNLFTECSHLTSTISYGRIYHLSKRSRYFIATCMLRSTPYLWLSWWRICSALRLGLGSCSWNTWCQTQAWRSDSPAQCQHNTAQSLAGSQCRTTHPCSPCRDTYTINYNDVSNIDKHPQVVLTLINHFKSCSNKIRYLANWL